jgi:hypothetical protein
MEKLKLVELVIKIKNKIIFTDLKRYATVEGTVKMDI